MEQNEMTYYRHRPEPVRAFESRREHRRQMQPALRVHGQVAKDGRLELIVTNLMTGAQQVIDL